MNKHEDKLTVIAADGGLHECGGMALLGDPLCGSVVAFRCTGHTPEQPCQSAYYVPAQLGAHFADGSGQCYAVCGDGVNAWVEPCFNDDCPGDTLTFPDRGAPVAEFDREEGTGT